jgi:hypothetical protein
MELVLCKTKISTLVYAPSHRQQVKIEYWTAKKTLLELPRTGLRLDLTTLHMVYKEMGGIRSARFSTIRLNPVPAMGGDFAGHVAYAHQTPSIVYEEIPVLHVPLQ